jgi:hypothetical protein
MRRVVFTKLKEMLAEKIFAVVVVQECSKGIDGGESAVLLCATQTIRGDHGFT